MEVAELETCGQLAAVDGKVMASSAARCAGGKGSTIDYCVVSQGSSALAQDVVRVNSSPTTHPLAL